MRKKLFSKPIHTQLVLFDLDGTLRHNEPDANTALFDAAVALGAPDSTENRRSASRWAHYYWAHSPEFHEDILEYPEMEISFWNQYIFRKLKVFSCSEKQAQELAPAVREYMEQDYQPEDIIPSIVPEILRGLTTAGYRVGLVTNRSQPVADYLATVCLDQYFELVVAAGEIDIWKPDPGIFQFALKKIGIPPEHTVYIGDNYFADIVGARRANIHPILYDHSQIFPDPDCQVIYGLAELFDLL